MIEDVQIQWDATSVVRMVRIYEYISAFRFLILHKLLHNQNR